MTLPHSQNSSLAHDFPCVKPTICSMHHLFTILLPNSFRLLRSFPYSNFAVLSSFPLYSFVFFIAPDSHSFLFLRQAIFFLFPESAVRGFAGSPIVLRHLSQCSLGLIHFYSSRHRAFPPLPASDRRLYLRAHLGRVLPLNIITLLRPPILFWPHSDFCSQLRYSVDPPVPSFFPPVSLVVHSPVLPPPL